MVPQINERLLPEKLVTRTVHLGAATSAFPIDLEAQPGLHVKAHIIAH